MFKASIRREVVWRCDLKIVSTCGGSKSLVETSGEGVRQAEEGGISGMTGPGFS